MSRSSPMTVEVGYEITEQPTDEHLACRRRGAKALTDDLRSIAVEQRATGDGHAVLVRFTMPPMAQYKVVDDIHRQFKISFASSYSYNDCWIAFPKAGTRPRGRRPR